MTALFVAEVGHPLDGLAAKGRHWGEDDLDLSIFVDAAEEDGWSRPSLRVCFRFENLLVAKDNFPLAILASFTRMGARRKG